MRIAGVDALRSSVCTRITVMVKASPGSTPRRYVPTMCASVQTEVMPRALQRLQRMLRVRKPVAGALKLPRSCTSSWDGSGKCASTGPTCNGRLREPVPASFYGATECAPIHDTANAVRSLVLCLARVGAAFRTPALCLLGNLCAAGWPPFPTQSSSQRESDREQLCECKADALSIRAPRDDVFAVAQNRRLLVLCSC